MSEFIKHFSLTQHSILIHFQAKYEDGENVCLRVSEVKPKLDRFIVKKLGGKEQCKSQYRDWIRAEHPNGVDIALKYQMVITRKDSNTIIYESGTRENRNPPNKLPDIFYGNMSNDQNAKKKYGVFFPGGLDLKIVCFDSGLMREIEENIGIFFAVTNFGTMQDKGFGSFTVNGRNVNYAAALKEAYSSRKCYIIALGGRGYNSSAQNEFFNVIKQVYSVMKSGQNIVDRDGNTIPGKYIRSFIYVYMHGVNIGNEKAFMKRKDVAPIRTTHTPKDTHENHQQASFSDNSFRYVRALLGIGENIEWIEPESEQRRNSSRPRKEKIKISDVTEDKKVIERLASPIFFKIIGSNIYITANQPDERAFDRTFRFENTGYTRDDQGRSHRQGHSVNIKTLSEIEGLDFDMADFLDKFMTYYHSNIRKLRYNYRITEVQ